MRLHKCLLSITMSEMGEGEGNAYMFVDSVDGVGVQFKDLRDEVFDFRKVRVKVEVAHIDDVV